MSEIEIVNPGTTPVVYSNDGRVLAAGERLTVAKLDTTGRKAREHGFLVVEEKPEEDETAMSEEPAETSSAEPGSAEPAETEEAGKTEKTSARRERK